jgi:hypothetical protein
MNSFDTSLACAIATRKTSCQPPAISRVKGGLLESAGVGETPADSVMASTIFGAGTFAVADILPSDDAAVFFPTGAIPVERTPPTQAPVAAPRLIGVDPIA